MGAPWLCYLQSTGGLCMLGLGVMLTGRVSSTKYLFPAFQGTGSLLGAGAWLPGHAYRPVVCMPRLPWVRMQASPPLNMNLSLPHFIPKQTVRLCGLQVPGV